MIKALAVVILLMSTISAAAIDCQPKAGGSGWSWRQIDGKRCWYKGAAGMDKAKLRWPAQVAKKRLPAEALAKARPRVPLDADGNVIHTSAEQRLIESYWGAKP